MKTWLMPGSICCVDPYNSFNRFSDFGVHAVIISREKWRPFRRSIYKVRIAGADYSTTYSIYTIEERFLYPPDKEVIRYPLAMPLFKWTEYDALDEAIKNMEALKKDIPEKCAFKFNDDRCMKYMKSILGKIKYELELYYYKHEVEKEDDTNEE